MKREILLEVICFLLVVLFTYAAASKLFDYEKFVVQIEQSPLLTGLGNFVPWLVISFEFLVSIFLLVSRFRLYALFGSLSLMTLFTSYIVAILNFSSFVPCSCGGVLEKLGWTEHLILNSLFIVLSVLGIYLEWTIEHQGKTHRANKHISTT